MNVGYPCVALLSYESMAIFPSRMPTDECSLNSRVDSPVYPSDWTSASDRGAFSHSLGRKRSSCDVLASTPRRHMTNITLLNTRVATRLALRTNLAALFLRSHTFSLLKLTEWIR